MKITVNIDEVLLNRAVDVSGASTKTEAITSALRELTRKAELVETLRKGTGLSPAELRDSFDEAAVSEFLRSRHLTTDYQVVSQSGPSHRENS